MALSPATQISMALASTTQSLRTWSRTAIKKKRKKKEKKSQPTKTRLLQVLFGIYR
jgi:TfoX/Sxy family transcriptional regulator of competence genes